MAKSQTLRLALLYGFFLSVVQAGCAKEMPSENRRISNVQSNNAADIVESTQQNNAVVDEPDPVVVEPGSSPPDALHQDAPCYLDEKVKKVVLELSPLIDKKQANFRSWPALIVQNAPGFNFQKDPDTLEITVGGNKRKRSFLEQVLWVCSTAPKTGYPATNPDSCKQVTVTTTKMELSFAQGISAVADKPDGSEGPSKSALALTLTSAELLSGGHNGPIFVKDLKHFDFKWTIKYRADDTQEQLRESYLTLDAGGDNPTKVGHIAAAYPHLQRLVLKVNDLPYYLWDRSVGNLYYARPSGFFKNKQNPKQGYGTYELIHTPAPLEMSHDGSFSPYNYKENPFVHHFIDSDITTNEWHKKHKEHCDSLTKK